MHDSIKSVEKLTKSENAAEQISAAVTAAYKAIDQGREKEFDSQKKTAARRKSTVAKLAKSVKVAKAAAKKS